jgi:RNA polymerase sigma-70 factor, ECF subfamily
MSLADDSTIHEYGEVHTMELVRLAVEGCEDAFSELSLRFRPRLLHVLQRRLGGRHADAEDIAQEALAKAFSNIARFDAKYQFSTWLYTIAFRVAQDHAQKNRRWFSLVSYLMPEVSVAHNDPAVEIEGNEQVSNLWSQAQRILTPDQYTVMWLRYGEDQSVEDISRILQKTKVSVRVLLHRARLVMVDKLSAGSDYTIPLTHSRSQGKCP